MPDRQIVATGKSSTFAASAREDAVPNSLDVAKQRKLVEDLKRDGRDAQNEETRLEDMLNFMTSVRGYGAWSIQRTDQKIRQNRSDPIAR